MASISMRPPPLLNGRYTVQPDRFSFGGTANIHFGQDIETGTRVVVKMPRDGSSYTEHMNLIFHTELKALQREGIRNAPDTAKLINHGELEGLPFLVLEEAKGVDMRLLLGSLRSYSLGKTLRQRCLLMLNILRTIESIHDAGVIHRDLKPENLLVRYHRRQDNPEVFEFSSVTVIDFGFARLNGDSSEAEWDYYRATKQPVGTPEYAPPEQHGQSLVYNHPDEHFICHPSSDNYSLAVLFYELLAGKRPFQDAQNVYELAYWHESKVPVPLSKIDPRIPEGLSSIVDRDLAKDPRSRHQHAREMRQSIESVLLAHGDVV